MPLTLRQEGYNEMVENARRHASPKGQMLDALEFLNSDISKQKGLFHELFTELDMGAKEALEEDCRQRAKEDR